MDDSKAVKGPFSTSILLNMLEKGLAVHGDTLVWRNGMSAWSLLSSTEPFGSMYSFLCSSWYYRQTGEVQQQGPVLSRLLLHKLKTGLLDGLTSVIPCGAHGQVLSGYDWCCIGEIPQFKDAIQKLMQEEERAAAIWNKKSDETDGGDVFEASQSLLVSDSSKVLKKSFVSDAGIAYM